MLAIDLINHHVRWTREEHAANKASTCRWCGHGV